VLEVGVQFLALNSPLRPGGWPGAALLLAWAVPLVVSVTGTRSGPRTGRWVAAALAVQLAVAFFFAVRLAGGSDWLPGGAAVLLPAGLLLFVAPPAVALVLVRSDPARRWYGSARGDAVHPPVAPGPARPPQLRRVRVVTVVLAVLALPDAAATLWLTGFPDPADEEAVAQAEQAMTVAVVVVTSAVVLLMGLVLVEAGLDRLTLVVGAALVVAVSVWWLLQAGAGASTDEDAGFIVLIALSHAALALTAASTVLSRPVGQYMSARGATVRTG
jgi:hypothetical protein